MTAADFDTLALRIAADTGLGQTMPQQARLIEFAKRLRAAWLAENEPVGTFVFDGDSYLQVCAEDNFDLPRFPLFAMPPSDPANEPIAEVLSYHAAKIRWLNDTPYQSAGTKLYAIPPSDPSMVQDALRYRFLRHARANDEEEIIPMSEEDYDKAVDETMREAAERKA